MNKWIGHGRLAKDVEMRYTTSGKAVASFTVAVDGVKRDSKAEFINCIAWEKNAENIGKFFSKGKEILISDGRLQTRSYDANDGSRRYVTEVIVNTFEFCGSKSDNKSTGAIKGEEVDAEIPFF